MLVTFDLGQPYLVHRKDRAGFSLADNSLRFNDHLTFVSQCSLTQRMMEAVVTAGAISRPKLQSNDHHQQTNTQFFYRLDALPVAQPTVSKH